MAHMFPSDSDSDRARSKRAACASADHDSSPPAVLRWPHHVAGIVNRPDARSASRRRPGRSALRFQMPTVTVTAQKEPEDKQKIPVSVTAVSAGHDRERRHPHRQRGGDLRAEHLLHGVDGAEAEQRPVPRHQLQPEQPGHHDLHRRRPAAQRQLLEHRAARRRSDRVRARSAERALRPEHARRAGEHHEQPAVADEVDGHARRSRSATTGRGRFAAGRRDRSSATR